MPVRVCTKNVAGKSLPKNQAAFAGRVNWP